MDKLLYIAASGAKQDLLGTAVRANNLANAQTIGFKAQMEQARAMPAFGEGLPTRVFSMTEAPSTKFEDGPLVRTERDLDIAVKGEGWISIIDQQGREAYTRSGSLQISTEGVLEDGQGNPVQSEIGPLVLPLPISTLDIANDGTISVRPQGAPESVLVPVGTVKLVNPDARDLERGADGLFRLKDGSVAEPDFNVRIASGMLEGSNVNAVEEMVQMIHLQRHYEMQVKLMKRADTMDLRGNQLLRII
jgi:flagellar basal-body rod protein FlgF